MNGLIRYITLVVVAALITWGMNTYTQVEFDFNNLIGFMALYVACQAREEQRSGG